MKLAAISMIRNEADIVAPFVRHLDAMFDIVLLLDQRSSDGSTKVMRAACGQRADWKYYFCDFSGRYQKELINLLTPKAFAMGADALFALDSDEFIALESRDELRQRALEMQNNVAAGRFFWRACVPVSFDEWKFDLCTPAWRARKAASVQKVALSRALFEQRPDLRFQQGSHDWEGTEHQPAMIELGDLYHFPLRSGPQTLLKTCIGSIANFAKGNLMSDEGWHKRQMLERIAVGGLDEASLAGFASLYSEESTRISSGEPPRMITEAFERLVLPIACSDLPLPELGKPDFDAALAHVLLEFKFEIASGPAPVFDLRGEIISLRAAAPRNLPEEIDDLSAKIQTLSTDLANLRTEAEQNRTEMHAARTETEAARNEIRAVQAELEAVQTKMEAFLNINWLIRISKDVRRFLGRRIHGE